MYVLATGVGGSRAVAHQKLRCVAGRPRLSPAARRSRAAFEVAVTDERLRSEGAATEDARREP